MWTSALHGVTNFILGDAQDADGGVPEQPTPDPAPLPMLSREQWFAMTEAQQQAYQRQWHAQQLREQAATHAAHTARHGAGAGAGTLMTSAPSSPSQLGSADPNAAATVAGAIAATDSQTSSLHPASQFDSVELHAQQQDEPGDGAAIAPSAFSPPHAEQQQGPPAPYSISGPPPAAASMGTEHDVAAGGGGASPTTPNDAAQQSTGGGGGTRALLARYLPAIPFRRPAGSDGNEQGGEHAHQSGTAAAVATAREAFSAAAGSVGHALSGIKSSLPRFTVSSGGGGGGTGGGGGVDGSDEVPALIHALQQEEARSARVSSEYKSIISELRTKMAAMEAELEQAHRETKKRDNELFDWKTKAQEQTKKVTQLEAQLAAAAAGGAAGGVAGAGIASATPELQQLQQQLKVKDDALATLTARLAVAEQKLSSSSGGHTSIASSAAAAAASPLASPPITPSVPAARAASALAPLSGVPSPSATAAPLAGAAAPSSSPRRSGAVGAPVSAAAGGTAAPVVARTPLTWSCPECKKLNLRTKPACGKPGCNGQRPELPAPAPGTVYAPAATSTAAPAAPAAAVTVPAAVAPAAVAPIVPAATAPTAATSAPSSGATTPAPAPTSSDAAEEEHAPITDAELAGFD